MAIVATRESTRMRNVNIAELKNRLSRYLTFAKGGEEIVIRDRNLPVAKLVPFSGDGSEAKMSSCSWLLAKCACLGLP
jgi:prevent-host-death family protein